MLEKLASLEQRYNELTEEVMTPALIADQKAWQKAMKARAELEEIVGVYSKYRKCLEDIAFAEEAAVDKSDEDMAELALSEMETCAEQKEFLETELRRLLIPKDKNDSKNVVLEVRAGTGGDEAALFAADLFRMYARYGERKGWRTEIIDANYTDAGGLKEIIVMLEGRDVYSRMKFESGVHRVQRVPATEASGRIHTSAATVAVLPEAEEVDVEINPNDIKTDVFCASGPGGQCVNTTQSAVRLTHIPTGIVVSCQDEKSQHKNKDKAMKVLRARVLEKTEEEQRQSSEAVRRQQVGSGDRSERIRTYNFPQGRVTDHRVGLTLHKLEWILQGDLDEIIDALSAFDQARRLSEGA